MWLNAGKSAHPLTRYAMASVVLDIKRKAAKSWTAHSPDCDEEVEMQRRADASFADAQREYAEAARKHRA